MGYPYPPTTFRSLTVNSTAQSVRGEPGKVFGINIINLHSAAIFVKLYDKAAASVAPASDHPKFTFYVAATSPLMLRGQDMPFYFGTQIAVRAVTGSGDTDTTAPGTLPIIEIDSDRRIED